jgi:hypothetical protein
MLENADTFCAQCGTNAANAPVMQDEQTPVPPGPPVCPNCGTQPALDDAFCQECGTPVGQTAAQLAGLPTAAAVGAAKTLSREAEKHRRLSKTVLIAAAAVIVLIAVAAGIFLLGSSGKSHLLYLKDDEINMTALNKIGPFELTDGLFDDDDAYSRYFYSEIRFSDDGNYMFYPENITEYDEFDLFYLSLKADNAKRSSAEKIDSGISSYAISQDGTRVFYLKNNKLYFYNLKEKIKLDSDVSEFYISGDGMKLVYLTDENDLYARDMKTDGAEKIDSDAQIEYVTEDLEKIYYLKNNNLYLKQTGSEKAKIDNGIGGVIRVFESGELYYFTSTTQSVPLSDYVTDDMTSDAVMTEPDYDDYMGEDSYGYSTFDSDAYYADWNAYYEKQERDSLRDALRSNTYTVTKRSLYYYDGASSVKVADDFYTDMTTGYDKAMLVYSKYDSTEVPTFKLSEITSYYDVQNALDMALNTGGSICLAIGGKETALELESAEYFRFNKAGTSLYYLENTSGDAYDLYARVISGDTAGKPELYDEDIYYSYYIFYDSDAVVYFKDVDTANYSGDLYIDKNKVDTDVYCYNMWGLPNEKTSLLYMVDYDETDLIGTLKKYDGIKTVKIADDVRDYVTDDKGTIAYITNYDTDDSVGDAYLYTGSRPKLIDEEVSYLLMIS